MEKENHRNEVAQTIVSKDGTRKTIFHAKKFGTGNYAGWWKQMNESPRKNSLRQRRLRGEI